MAKAFESQFPRKPFKSKGANVVRCPDCLLAQSFCICGDKVQATIDADYPVEVWLLMHKEESYKPSNTGRLIEDVLPSAARRFYWHRTEPDPEFLALLENPDYQVYIIFPGDRGGYDERIVTEASWEGGKTPVFLILDGSWRQAGRMFRLSKYLQHLPVLPLSTTRESQYKLRKAPDEFHLCTVEVAIELLAQHHQPAAAQTLLQYFQHFNDTYARSRRETLPKSKND